jgi:glycosyltransferase involved in cell wall biosynthesis
MSTRPVATAWADSGVPLVTVVVPTRDRPELLQIALASIEDQRLPLELVVVDEASSSPVSSDILPRGVSGTVIRHEHPRGPAAARNSGVRAGSAPFVAFLDDDDHWLPDKLARCLEAFDRHPDVGLVIHRMRFAGTDTQGSGTLRRVPNGVQRMLRQQPPHVDAILVRREVHDAVQFDEAFPAAADLDYMLRLALAAPVAELDEVLGEHRAPGGVLLSEISLSDRIAGRQRFLEKHRSHFDRPALGFYWMRLGHLYRRAGHRVRSAGCFARSLWYWPLGIHGWKGLVLAIFPRSVERS